MAHHGGTEMTVLHSYFYRICSSAYLTRSRKNHKRCLFILIIVFGVSVLPLLIPRLSLVIAVSQERGFRTNYCLFLQPPLLQFLYFHTWRKKITKQQYLGCNYRRVKFYVWQRMKDDGFERSNMPLRRFFFCRPLTLKIKWAGLFAYCKQGHNGGSLWGLH